MHTLLLKPGLLAFITVVVVVLYMIVTLRLIRRNARLLWIPALLVALSATLLYWQAFKVTGVSNWFSHLVISVTTALDLFLFKAFCSLGVSPYFFASAGSTPEQAAVVNSHLILLFGLFLCAIWTTSILIVHLFARRFSSRLWLLFHRPSRKKTHLFFGANGPSLSVAGSLAQERKDRIVFVIFPEQESLPAKISFFQFFRGISSGTESYRRIRGAVPDAVILSARTPLLHCSGSDFFRDMGLSGLSRWVQDPETVLYLLSDNFPENLFALQSLPDCPAQILCRTNRQGLNDSLELSANRNVRLVDRAFLTVKQMKGDASFHPVHFVERALDRDGQPKGWVDGGFHSMVLGFGETGRGALDFLYEFGAFVGKDKRQIPFLCEIVDREASAMAGGFALEHAGIPEGRVRFLPFEIGSEAFWKHFAEALPTLNYVVVSLGDDATNVSLALDILEMACRAGRPKLPAIVVQLDDASKYRKIIDFHAASLKADCIRILDGTALWTVENLVDDSFEQDAKRFYEGYCRAVGEALPWEARRDAVVGAGQSAFWKKREYRRKVGQDYSDYMHMRVKAQLCPALFREDPSVADSIPSVYEGVHCTDDTFKDVLTYLAIGEHLRWLAAHEAAGYRYGAEKREDLKIHPAMVDYASLSEETRHYDWVVVKTSLSLLCGEARSNTPA